MTVCYLSPIQLKTEPVDTHKKEEEGQQKQQQTTHKEQQIKRKKTVEEKGKRKKRKMTDQDKNRRNSRGGRLPTALTWWIIQTDITRKKSHRNFHASQLKCKCPIPGTSFGHTNLFHSKVTTTCMHAYPFISIGSFHCCFMHQCLPFATICNTLLRSSYFLQGRIFLSWCWARARRFPHKFQTPGIHWRQPAGSVHKVAKPKHSVQMGQKSTLSWRWWNLHSSIPICQMKIWYKVINSFMWTSWTKHTKGQQQQNIKGFFFFR